MFETRLEKQVRLEKSQSFIEPITERRILGEANQNTQIQRENTQEDISTYDFKAETQNPTSTRFGQHKLSTISNLKTSIWETINTKKSMRSTSQLTRSEHPAVKNLASGVFLNSILYEEKKPNGDGFGGQSFDGSFMNCEMGYGTEEEKKLRNLFERYCRKGEPRNTGKNAKLKSLKFNRMLIDAGVIDTTQVLLNK